MARRYNRKYGKHFRRRLRRRQTPAERQLWHFIRRRQIANCRFRRQVGIECYTVDFFVPELRLAIEVDGGIHDRPDRKQYDIRRQCRIERLGVRFLRFTNDEIFNQMDQVLAEIERVVTELRVIYRDSFK